MLSCKIAEANGEAGPSSPYTILVAVTGGRNRIYKIILSTPTTGILTLSDGFGVYHAVAGIPVTLDYGEFGKVQTNSDTVITLTHSAVASVSALVQYETN